MKQVIQHNGLQWCKYDLWYGFCCAAKLNNHNTQCLNTYCTVQGGSVIHLTWPADPCS